MRNLLLVVLLSAPIVVACGEAPGMPTVPSTDMPEAGMPEAPAAPDATDGGAAAAPAP